MGEKFSRHYRPAKDQLRRVVNSLETRFPVEPYEVVITAFEYLKSEWYTTYQDLLRKGFLPHDYYWKGKYSKIVDALIAKKQKLDHVFAGLKSNNVGPFLTYASKLEQEAAQSSAERSYFTGTHQDATVIWYRKLGKFWKNAAFFAPSFFTSQQLILDLPSDNSPNKQGGTLISELI